MVSAARHIVDIGFPEDNRKHVGYLNHQTKSCTSSQINPSECCDQGTRIDRWISWKSPMYIRIF